VLTEATHVPIATGCLLNCDSLHLTSVQLWMTMLTIELCR